MRFSAGLVLSIVGAGLGLVLAGFVSAALAQPSHRDSTQAAAPADTTKPALFLKQVVVTGARYPKAYYESPQALSFVSRAQIRDQDPTVLGDVLSTLPGVDNSKDSPWEQRPVLRGLGGQRVLVLMDGSPMNSARGNGPHPSLVGPQQVDRVEVVRGPSSVAYGSDALGGAINIITREAPPTGLTDVSGAASLGYSSVDQQRNGYLELLPRVGKLSAFLSTAGRKAEDFDSPNGEVKFSSFSDYNALANLRYDVTSKTALKAAYQLYRAHDVGIPGLSFETPPFSQEFSFPFYDRDYVHLVAEHRYDRTWLDRATVKGYWQRESRNFFSHEDASIAALPPGPPPPPGADRRLTDQDRNFDLSTYGVQLQATSPKTSYHLFTAGVDAARDLTDGDNIRHRHWTDSNGATVLQESDRVTASVPDGTFDNYGGYAQSDWYLRPQLTLSAGARYTHYAYDTEAGVNVAGNAFEAQSQSDDALCGSVGLVYAPHPDLHLSANVANGYRQPNAQDLFFSGPASVGFVIGNENLKPERSVSYDAGVRWGPGDLALSGNLFYSTYEDLIDAVYVKTTSSDYPAYAQGQPAYMYQNISTARIWGGEAEGEWRFMPQWLARASVAGAIGDITSHDAIQTLYGVDADQVPLANVPPFKGGASLRWRNDAGWLWVEPSMRFSWRTNRLPPPTPGVPQPSAFKQEWLVGDLFASVSIPSGQRLLVGVRNLADTEYQQPLGSLDEPGRSFVATLSTNF
jgi:TonB-dependent heme/hemoglobin receptor